MPDSRVCRPYSSTEDDYLRDHFLAQSHNQMAEAIGRTARSVAGRCSRQGWTVDRSWSVVDLAMLRAWYAERTGKRLDLDGLAVRLHRHKTNICRKARELGLSDLCRTTGYRRTRKFENAEDRRAAMSALRREYFRTHPHPRGALGHKHSVETRAIIGAKSRAAHERRTPAQRSVMARKSVMTRVEIYGSACLILPEGANPYSRAAGGYREDIGIYVRSAWEANYSRYLNWLIEQGEILSWEYEADTFVFHGETRGAITYRPDFKVTERDGSIVYHEVKGWMDGPSKTRLKRMKKHYPDVRIVVIGEDEYKALSKWKGLIPEWETGTKRKPK